MIQTAGYSGARGGMGVEGYIPAVSIEEAEKIRHIRHAASTRAKHLRQFSVREYIQNRRHRVQTGQLQQLLVLNTLKIQHH
jgi:hypothetical protein